MGLAQLQQALARLYTDHDLRARFLERGDNVALCQLLTEQQREQLSAISPQRVDDFAKCLIGKRRAHVRRLLPWTCDALQQQLFPLFFKHATTFQPKEVGRHRDDALAFVRFLRRHAPRVRPQWVTELARYEAAWIRARQSDGCCFAGIFRHAPSDLMRAAQHTIDTTPLRPTLAIWLRMPRSPHVRHRTLPLWLFTTPRMQRADVKTMPRSPDVVSDASLPRRVAATSTIGAPLDGAGS